MGLHYGRRSLSPPPFRRISSNGLPFELPLKNNVSFFIVCFQPHNPVRVKRKGLYLVHWGYPAHRRSRASHISSHVFEARIAEGTVETGKR